jgi:hypothetical protein
MAALWNIAVLDKGPDWVTVEVRQAHPDAGPFPEARSFALRLLHERAWEFDASFHYRALGPLGAACDSKQVLDEAWVTANVDRFIAGIVTQDPEVTAIDEAAAERRVADQLGLGDVAQLGDDDRERFDAAYQQFWNTPSALPARRYRIEVPDPGYLSHIAVGERWASAAF